jgi:hypothetical protein
VSLGNLGSENNNNFANEGLWRSTNGGANWAQVSTPSSDATDVVFDPAHTGVAYAGYSQDVIYRSTDHGATWTTFDLHLSTLASGMTTGDIYRTSLGLAADGSVLYAAIADRDTRDGDYSHWGQLLAGKYFTILNPSGMPTIKAVSAPSTMANDEGQSQWWYNDVVAVDPTNPNTVYMGGVGRSGYVEDHQCHVHLHRSRCHPPR